MSDLGLGRINRAAAANLPKAALPLPLCNPHAPQWRVYSTAHCDVLVSSRWQIALPTLIVTGLDLRSM